MAKQPGQLRVLKGGKPDETEDKMPLMGGPPECPAWITTEEGEREWSRMVPVLLNLGLLGVGDLPAFANYCAIHGRLAEIWAEGLTPPATLLAQFANYGAAFGLSPAWRAKVKASEDEGDENPFKKHRSKNQ